MLACAINLLAMYVHTFDVYICKWFNLQFMYVYVSFRFKFPLIFVVYTTVVLLMLGKFEMLSI